MKVCKAVLILFFVFSFIGISSAQSDMNNDAIHKEIAVKRVIQQFFKGLQSGDTITLKNTLADTVILQTTYKNKEGRYILRTDDLSKVLKSIASKKPGDNWEERLLSYHIQMDDNMANVWTPYEFYLNNDFSHCGVNSFQLFFDGSWKIIYLIDTRRKKDCNQ